MAGAAAWCGSPKGRLLHHGRRCRHCSNSAALSGKREQQEFNYPLEAQFRGIAADINGDSGMQRRAVAGLFPPLSPLLVLCCLNLYWSARRTVSPACNA